MPTVRLSPGDLEKLAALESERIVTALESLVPRFLPQIIDMSYTCEICGALVMDKQKHLQWHESIVTLFKWQESIVTAFRGF